MYICKYTCIHVELYLIEGPVFQHGMYMFRTHVFRSVNHVILNLTAAHHVHSSIDSSEEHTSDVRTETTAADTQKPINVGD